MAYPHTTQTTTKAICGCGFKLQSKDVRNMEEEVLRPMLEHVTNTGHTMDMVGQTRAVEINAVLPAKRQIA